MANFIEEPDSPPSPESDPEACILPVDLYDPSSDGVSTPSSSHTSSPEDGLVDNLQWDEDDIMTPTQNLNSHQWNAPVITPARPPALCVPQERTPLIRKANSFHIPTTKKVYDSIEGKKKTKTRTRPPRKVRPLEPTQKVQEIKAVERRHLGRSTFGQTVSIKRVPAEILSELFSTFSTSSCSMRSLYSSVSGCCRSPSPFPMPGGVVVPCCSSPTGG